MVYIGGDVAFFTDNPYIRRNKLVELEKALRGTASTVLVVGAPHSLKTACVMCVRCVSGGAVGCQWGLPGQRGSICLGGGILWVAW